MAPRPNLAHRLCKVLWEHKLVLGQPHAGVRAAFRMTVTEVSGQDGDLLSLKYLLTWTVLERLSARPWPVPTDAEYCRPIMISF